MHMACCYGNRDTVPVQCSLCGDVPEINQLINQSLSNRKEFAALSSTTDACKDNTAPTVPGGHRQPGMQARLTQGRSRFWQVLAHSRPFSPVSQSVRMSGGGHWAALRSGWTKNAACLVRLDELNDQAFLNDNSNFKSKSIKRHIVVTQILMDFYWFNGF